jgi:iron(III) transport system permease protein
LSLTVRIGDSTMKGMWKNLTDPLLHRSFSNPWVWTSIFAALLIVFPLSIIFSHIFDPVDEIWHHIVNNLLASYVLNTLFLLTGVALFTMLIGVSTAWLVSMYRFPGRSFFEWALIMPIAIPAYISGFTWAGILDYTSPVYMFLRNSFGTDTGQYLFFKILSPVGAVIIFSLALYPYVYLISRAYFIRQSGTLLEAAASLGKSPFRIFTSVALPMARPAIVAGVSLALMEVLNDYGLVRYFGIETFTTGIFSAWFAFANPVAAMKLSGYLLVIVLFLIFVERFQRGQMRYSLPGGIYRPARVHILKHWKAGFAIMACMIPFLLGFLFPAIMLIYWSSLSFSQVGSFRFWELLGNSFLLAAIAAIIVVIVAILIAFTVRSFPARLTKILTRISTLGYAIPGAVVAIGIMVPFIWIDSQFNTLTGQGIRMAITGTWFALIYAYTVRFMAVGYNSVESGLEKISNSMDEASRSLGQSNRKTLFRILLPLLKSSLISGALLVFIDVLKELPLTLILRPFNFDTLAIRAFEFAADERLAEAAPAALVIILAGMIPVILLNRIMGKE